jgi:hypothetical protein
MTYMSIIIPSTPSSSKENVKVTLPHISITIVLSSLTVLSNIPEFIRPNFIQMDMKFQFKVITGKVQPKNIAIRGK